MTKTPSRRRDGRRARPGGPANVVWRAAAFLVLAAWPLGCRPAAPGPSGRAQGPPPRAAAPQSPEEALAAFERNCPPAYPDPAAGPPPVDVLAARSIDELIGELGNWSPLYRVQVGKALALKGPPALDALRAAIAHSDNWRVRCGAITAMITPLREKAARYDWLVRHDRPVTEAQRVEAVRTREHYAPALATLAAALRDAHPAVRYRAIEALGLLGPFAADTADALLTVAADDQADWVSERAIQDLDRFIGLEKVPPARALPRLIRILKHPKPRARMHAAHALSLLGDAARPAVPDLIECIRNRATRDPMFADGSRLTAMQMLSEWRVPEGVPLCVMILKQQGWGDARRKPAAIEALARYGPAARSAVPAMEEVIAELQQRSPQNETFRQHVRELRQAIATITGRKVEG